MYKVIIIDDNRLIADSLSKLDIWKPLNCEIIDVCYDSLSGKKAILNSKPDIVLTDIKIPGKDGLEIIREVLNDLPDLKVICMSAYDDFVYLRRAIKLKCVDYLLKPFSKEDLEKVFSDLLDEMKEKSSKVDIDDEEEKIDNPILKPIVDYIAANMAKGITAEDVANEFYISTSKLYRIIQKYYGKSFHEFWMELRMNRAKELLMDLRLSMEEVAENVGYANYFSFYRAFIRETGIAPTDFRNMQLRE